MHRDLSGDGWTPVSCKKRSASVYGQSADPEGREVRRVEGMELPLPGSEDHRDPIPIQASR
jgi:hypothetical protein